jgi:hypothetical protein
MKRGVVGRTRSEAVVENQLAKSLDRIAHFREG